MPRPGDPMRVSGLENLPQNGQKRLHRFLKAWKSRDVCPALDRESLEPYRPDKPTA